MSHLNNSDIMSMLPIEPLDKTVSLKGSPDSQGNPTTPLRRYGYSIAPRKEDQKSKQSSVIIPPQRQSFETESTAFSINEQPYNYKTNIPNSDVQRNQYAKDFTVSKDVQDMLKGRSHGDGLSIDGEPLRASAKGDLKKSKSNSLSSSSSSASSKQSSSSSNGSKGKSVKDAILSKLGKSNKTNQQGKET